MEGLHLTGDLTGCSAEPLLNVTAAQLFCRQAVRDAGLSAVRDVFHGFGEGLGFTGVVLLAESHVALHTWPELGSVTLDVYVCNHTQDNREAAQNLFDGLVQFFQPKYMAQQKIERAKSVLHEPLTPHVAQLLSHCDLIEQGQTHYQHYAVYQHPSFGKLLTLDGTSMVSEQDEFIYHEMLTHLPACSVDTLRHALIIGGGDGGCAEELLKHNSLVCIDWVEIDADVINVARQHFSSIHHGSFDDVKVRLHIADGSNFVNLAATYGEKYDLILLDLTDPQGLAIDLYTPLFFEQCASILSLKGVLAMHLGSPFFHAERVSQLLNDLAINFRIVRPYGVSVPLYGAYWGFAAASQFVDPMHMARTQVEQRLEERAIQNLNCYSSAFHFGSMQLPNFFAKLKIR